MKVTSDNLGGQGKMSLVMELIRTEADGTISFGNHTLTNKAKKEDFEHAGDIYKVKTFATMTKLEKNGLFVYESVPGTSVNGLLETEKGMEFVVEGMEDAQITVGLEDDTEYEVFVDGKTAGKMKTNLAGKLNVSVELADAGEVNVKIVK